MKNKKLIALLMGVAMSFATAVGCGGESEDSSSKEAPSSSQESVSSEEVVESSEEVVESSEEVVESSEEEVESSEDVVESSEEVESSEDVVESSEEEVESSEEVVESSEEEVESSEEVVESSEEEVESSEGVESSEEEVESSEEPEITYTVTFAGAEVEAQTVTENGTVAKPTDPAKDHYTFIGWYNGETAWNFATDKVTGDVTLTAKFEANTYTVKFVDFSGNATELTYTCETVEAFVVPEVPAAPEHYENARWDKTAEEYIVYSDEAIEVNAIADAKVYTVSFDTNGAEAMEAVEVTYGDALVIEETPVLDGYAFKGWTLNGEAYDTSALVSADVTLKATWYAKTEESTDSVISAQTVLDGVQLEDGYGYKEEAVAANPNAGWYFDSDYHCVTGANNTDDNKFANWVKFTLTYDGGAGTSDTGRETYLVMPAINYKLYSKVDFAYTNNANIKALSIYGTEVSQYGGNNKLISIVTDESGTKLYFREINSVSGDVTVGADAVIELPESVANGSEGLKLNITVGGWFKFAVTEMHATSNYIDYTAIMADALAKLPETADELTGSEEERAAVFAYLEAEQYLTSAEREGYTTPVMIMAAAETIRYNAVVNAENGSDEQAKAIKEYAAFIETYPELRNETHIAAINTIISENFVELQTEVLLNDPTVDTTKGAVDQNERIQTGWGAIHQEYNTTYETYIHMIQFTSGDFDSTVTLSAMNYNEYEEVYFGLYAIASQNGTVSILGQSYSFDNSKGHSFKVTIKDGTLTMADDSKSNNDGGVVIFTATLPAEVANGTTGLVIDFQFDAWSQAEITEMHTSRKVNKLLVDVYDNAVTMEMSGTTVATELRYDASSYWGTGTHTAFNTSYTKQNLVSFNAAADGYTAIFTLPKFDFTQYDEAYFGFTAATAEGNTTVTVGGGSYTYDLNAGYLYVKMLVKDGVLTVIGDGANNAGTVYMTVELSEAVLNGSEALTITWETVGWAQVEITEMHAVTEITPLA